MSHAILNAFIPALCSPLYRSTHQLWIKWFNFGMWTKTETTLMVVKERLPGDGNDQRFKRKRGKKKPLQIIYLCLGHCSLVL